MPRHSPIEPRASCPHDACTLRCDLQRPASSGTLINARTRYALQRPLASCPPLLVGILRCALTRPIAACPRCPARTLRCTLKGTTASGTPSHACTHGHTLARPRAGCQPHKARNPSCNPTRPGAAGRTLRCAHVLTRCISRHTPKLHPGEAKSWVPARILSCNPTRFVDGRTPRSTCILSCNLKGPRASCSQQSLHTELQPVKAESRRHAKMRGHAEWT